MILSQLILQIFSFSSSNALSLTDHFCGITFPVFCKTVVDFISQCDDYYTETFEIYSCLSAVS